jgi:hypothetical protein
MDILQPYLPYIVIALALLALLQMLLIMSLSGRITRLSRTVRGVLLGPNGEDLEVMLQRSMSESGEALRQNELTNEMLRALEEQVRGCVQRVGLVRYDAYEDVSGLNSFSLALLDANNTGTVISGLVSRGDGRCYAKTIINGQTEQVLSDEEQQAITMAQSGGLSSGVVPQSNGRKKGRFTRA